MKRFSHLSSERMKDWIISYLRRFSREYPPKSHNILSKNSSSIRSQNFMNFISILKVRISRILIIPKAPSTSTQAPAATATNGNVNFGHRGHGQECEAKGEEVRLVVDRIWIQWIYSRVRTVAHFRHIPASNPSKMRIKIWIRTRRGRDKVCSCRRMFQTKLKQKI